MTWLQVALSNLRQLVVYLIEHAGVSPSEIEAEMRVAYAQVRARETTAGTR